jgi:hypothetical protein
MNDAQKKLRYDAIASRIFLSIAIICASVIVFIIFFIFIKGIGPFIIKYPKDGELYTASLGKFIIGTTWTNYNYGILGMLINTIYIVLISSIFSFAISVLTALFIVRIAPKRLGKAFEMVIELLASIPSIVFGLFGQGFICPMVRDFAGIFGLQTAGGSSTLSTIIVLIMMMIPTITMLSITSMRAVKQDQINASLALGATKAQTDYKIVIAGAKSGIFSAMILGIGRALGEATAVSMVCGNAAEGPVFNMFGITRTLTSTMMLGLHETTGVDYDIRFTVGIVLIILILGANIGLNKLRKRMIK